MTTLNIEGKRVKVSDEFLNLSAAEQERTVEEIAKEIGAAPEPSGNGFMGQVNRGIADTVGGLVDFVNPLDNLGVTGSAKTGLADAMGAIGANVAEGEPETIWQGVGRGTGAAAGSMIPAGLVSRAMAGAGGLIGNVADDAAQALSSRSGVAAEMVAGGMAGAGEEAAEQAGAPEWAQDLAGIAAPMSVPAAVGVARVAGKVSPGANIARGAYNSTMAAVAPYTRSGGREVARRRMQDLVGGQERGAELAKRITGDSDLGLTPARETGDRNLIGLEEMAADQDPNLRARLDQREMRSRQGARDQIDGMGGDPEAARAFLETRRQQFRDRLEGEARSAVERAERRLQSIAPDGSEADNSTLVMREIDNAYDKARAEEADLWGRVPRGATVRVDYAAETARRLIDETSRAQQSDIPGIIKSLLGPRGKFGEEETVNEMHGLYSKLRGIARNSVAGTQRNENMARIANSVADDILRDLGAVDGSTPVGYRINEARAYSAAMHEAFDQGAVGRLRRKTVDGDTATDPELALQRTIGRGGETASVANRQIQRAAGSGQAEYAVQDYIKDRFAQSAISPEGEFTRSTAARFIRDNQALLAQYPELRQEILGAVGNRASADRLQERVADVVKNAYTARQSALAGFVDGPPDKAINSIFQSKSPARQARILRNAVGKDETGKALSGLKGAFASRLISGSTRSVGGQTQIDPERLAKMLDDPQMSGAMRVVFSPAEINRMRRINTELARLDMPGQNIGASLSGAEPNRLIEYAARVVAARQGADLGGGGGGSLQTAQMASARTKEILGKLVSDKAAQILADAVEDPELFRALLTDMEAAQLDKKILPKFLPYLVGGASAAAATE